MERKSIVEMFATLTRWNRGKRDEVRGKKIKIFSLFQPLASDL